MNKLNVFSCLLILFLFFPAAVNAQNSAPSGSSDAERKTRAAKEPEKLLYEEVNMQKLSRMYWAIGKNDIENDVHIDNYFLINECDIYRDYFHDEFEWKEVRKTGRDFIVKNKRNFPLRFEFILPLYLMEYDFEREGFDVLDEYQTQAVRRFEFFIPDRRARICGVFGNIEGYPKGLIVEMSRPFTLDFIPVKMNKAKDYIARKMDDFKKLSEGHQTQDRLYKSRDAYLSMKIKLFAYKGMDRTKDGYNQAIILGVLEGYDIYSDQHKRDLLYSKNYRIRKERSAMEEKLIDEYKRKRQEMMDEESRKKGGLLSE